MKLKVGIVVALCLAMLVSGFSVQGVKAKGVESEWLVNLSCPDGSARFYDVAWNTNGSLALYVGDSLGSSTAWLFYAETGTWAPAGGGPWTTTRFKAVEYIPGGAMGAMFLVMGDCGGPGRYYYMVIGVGDTTLYVNSDVALAGFNAEDIVFNPSTFTAEAVGWIPVGGAVAFSFNLLAPAWSARAGLAVTFGETWLAAALDSTYNKMVLVGCDVSNGNAIYDVYDFSSGLATYPTPLQAILTGAALDPTTGNILVTSANRQTGDTAGLYYFAGPTYSTPPAGNLTLANDTYDLWGIEVNANGRGIAVGYDRAGGYGLVYDLWRVNGKYSWTNQSNGSALFASQNFTSVAIRPMGIPMAMIAGSSFKYSYLNSNGNVIVNTIYPHISRLEMVHSTNAASVLNSEVNVDPGDNSNWYNVSIQGNLSLAAGGSAAIDYFEVFMWHDGGATGVDNSASFNRTGRNVGLHMWWTIADGFVMDYPTTGEFVRYGAGGSTGFDGDTNFTCSFFFQPRQQARNGTSAGTWSAGVNPFGTPGRFWGNDGIEDQSDPVTALDDDNSWDIKFVVVENTSSASAAAYDEFGISRYVYLGTGASLPGNGQLTGNGAPGQNVTLAPNVGESVSYNANCWYDLRVWTTDLNASIPANGIIPALNLSLSGGAVVYQTFAGPTEANAIYLLGGGAATYETMLNNFTSTTTLTAPTGGVNFVIWCTIPLGKAEDSYVGVMTYSITSEAP